MTLNNIVTLKSGLELT